MNSRPDNDPDFDTRHASSAYGVDRSRTTGSLLHEVMREVPDLLTKELALARSEMRENLAQTRRGAMAVSAGGVVLVGGYIVLLLAAVYALSLVVAPWAAALIVGGIAAIAGYAMVKSGSRQFSAHDLKPERTIDSIHKDADAIRRARHEYH